MPSARTDGATARDRVLLAAAELLDAANGMDVSTRAICERAGAQAPTLYHHFGSKQGLFDAVITHGFKQFLAERAAGEQDPARDPIVDIREGWDLHVRYGLENPGFYALIYGRTVPGQRCGVVTAVEEMILTTLRRAARERRLRVAPERAARQIVAASTGVVLTLITQPAGTVDVSLSDQVRDAILDGITTPAGPNVQRDRDDASLHAAAIALLGALHLEPTPLSAAESALLREWLTHLSSG